MYYKWGSAEFLTSRPNITKSIQIRHPLVISCQESISCACCRLTRTRTAA